MLLLISIELSSNIYLHTIVIKQIDRILGDICSYSRDCASGCCLMDRSTRQRTCQPLAGWGDKCSMGQVKGDLYVDACPCKAGPDVCTFPAGVCSK